VCSSDLSARRSAATARLQVRGRGRYRYPAPGRRRRARARRRPLRIQGAPGGGSRDGAARRARRAHRRAPPRMSFSRIRRRGFPAPLIASSTLVAFGAAPAAAQTGLPAALPAAAATSGAVSEDARSGADPQLREILKQAISEASSLQDRFDAEVWLTDMSNRMSRQVDEPKERLDILKSVHRHATRVGLEPELLLAVIDVESNFDRFAISSAGALGLMQVMPFWV